MTMKRMNSESIRNALEEMLAALKVHDRDMVYVMDCKHRVKAAVEKLKKAERKFGETQVALMGSQAKLRDEGFLTNPSVYEPED